MPEKTPSEAMHELRLAVLSRPPQELGQMATPQFPNVCGIVMDWPIQSTMASVVGFASGDASLYTTGDFGVIGGYAHEKVRGAAKSFVAVGEQQFERAHPTVDYSYPQSDRVRFYFVGYKGVRLIEKDLAAVANGEGAFADLFDAGQAVLTELRMITKLH